MKRGAEKFLQWRCPRTTFSGFATEDEHFCLSKYLHLAPGLKIFCFKEHAWERYLSWFSTVFVMMQALKFMPESVSDTCTCDWYAQLLKNKFQHLQSGPVNSSRVKIFMKSNITSEVITSITDASAVKGGVRVMSSFFQEFWYFSLQRRVHVIDSPDL